ncbi:UNVERIFIED_CONTAM: hypothetical protein HDU68_010162, partial [Siphonaria sp. JEL0065]
MSSRFASKENLLMQALATAATLLENSNTTKQNEAHPVEEKTEEHQELEISSPKTISQYVNPTEPQHESHFSDASKESSIDMALLMQSVLSLDNKAKESNESVEKIDNLGGGEEEEVVYEHEV